MLKQKYVLAIDVGGTKLTLAVFDGEKIVARQTKLTDRTGGRDWVLSNIVLIAGAWKSSYPFTQCGVSFGGPVDFYKQCIIQSTHVQGWDDFDLVGWLRDNLAVTAIIDNDANAAALGEAVFGSGRGYDPFVYLTLSTGIGGGILVNGSILHGPDSFAGEIGHITLIPDGPQCLCGARGCLERMCSGLWLEHDYGRPARDLLQNPDFVASYVMHLAHGLKTVIMLLNPARISIGGGMSKAGDALFVPLREELSRQIPPWSRARIEVVPAQYPDDCTLLGALELTRRGLE